jgi:hypothetical protein
VSGLAEQVAAQHATLPQLDPALKQTVPGAHSQDDSWQAPFAWPVNTPEQAGVTAKRFSSDMGIEPPGVAETNCAAAMQSVGSAAMQAAAAVAS